jgi:O-methyltransferase
MAAIVEKLPADDPEISRYYANGYRSIDAFLAEAKQFPVRLFEPNATATRATATHKERREGKRGLVKWLLESLSRTDFDYFEFGVMSCGTFNRVIEWTPNSESKFYGFDTFDGLPEPWVRIRKDGSLWTGRDIGDLKSASPPAVYDARAMLFKGLFQDTLPDALGRAFSHGRTPGRAMVLNIDSDLYSSALYALTSMHVLLRSGDYVYFDEFFDPLNEFSAFNDYIRSYNTKAWFVPIARAYDGMLFRIDIPETETPADVIDQRSTRFLERLKAYVRARVSLLKANDPGRI